MGQVILGFVCHCRGVILSEMGISWHFFEGQYQLFGCGLKKLVMSKQISGGS